ncbi:hypothetical protein MKEN_00414700 [Mycena kentingensis (nom. inval.)]|nr:hypothetical protein MKEN_00414700 [Mycena kentingensis (nom. inval.)]
MPALLVDRRPVGRIAKRATATQANKRAERVTLFGRNPVNRRRVVARQEDIDASFESESSESESDVDGISSESEDEVGEDSDEEEDVVLPAAAPPPKIGNKSSSAAQTVAGTTQTEIAQTTEAPLAPTATSVDGTIRAALPATSVTSTTRAQSAATSKSVSVRTTTFDTTTFVPIPSASAVDVGTSADTSPSSSATPRPVSAARLAAPNATIAGGVVGGLVLIAILALGACLFIRRRRRGTLPSRAAFVTVYPFANGISPSETRQRDPESMWAPSMMESSRPASSFNYG